MVRASLAVATGIALGMLSFIACSGDGAAVDPKTNPDAADGGGESPAKDGSTTEDATSADGSSNTDASTSSDGGLPNDGSQPIDASVDAGTCLRLEARLVDAADKVVAPKVNVPFRIAAVIHNDCAIAYTIQYRGFTYSQKLPEQVSVTMGSEDTGTTKTFTVPPGAAVFLSAKDPPYTPLQAGEGTTSIRFFSPPSPKLSHQITYNVAP